MLFRKKTSKNLNYFPINKYVRKEFRSLPDYISSNLNRQFGRVSLNASLTVEAALVIPIFLYFVIGMLFLFQLTGSAGTMAGSIQDTVKQMGVYAYAVKNSSGDTKTAADCVSALYARSCLQKGGGEKEIQLVKASFLDGDEYIDLVAAWKMDAEVPLFHFGETKVLQRGCVRAWTGRDFREERKNAAQSSGEMVYVAATGTVYHKDRNCTHLRLSIRQVLVSAAGSLRNRYGAKYYACSCCRKGTGATVYITDTGTRYHADRSCSGLKRSVHQIKLSDVDNLPPCSKCGG